MGRKNTPKKTENKNISAKEFRKISCLQIHLSSKTKLKCPPLKEPGVQGQTTAYTRFEGLGKKEENLEGAQGFTIQVNFWTVCVILVTHKI